MGKISMLGMDYLVHQRGIEPAIADQCGIYTGVRAGSSVVADERHGDILCFPFIESGYKVGCKYRALREKQFWADTGTKLTFWNVDALIRSAVVTERKPVVITEGELDALSAIQAGYAAISVPNGAPQALVPGRSWRRDLNLDDEMQGRFAFLWHARKQLRAVSYFILATDDDGPGNILKQELIRRLSASRCYEVNYPAHCKDLNDVLIQHGPTAVKEVLDLARACPVSGVFKLSEYPEAAEQAPFDPPWFGAQAHFRPFLGEFCLITGIPSHGKSTFAINLLVGLGEALGDNFRSAIFSPEMPVKPHLRRKLLRLYMPGVPPGLSSGQFDQWLSGRPDVVKHIRATIDRRHIFIDRDPAADDEDMNVDWLLDRATEAVYRHGIKALLVDPWNELEHAPRRHEMFTDYIGRAIRSMKRWAQQYEVMVFVVAHPSKAVGEGGKLRGVTPYDVEGSAHWYNKPDHILVISREVGEDGYPVGERLTAKVVKSRFEECGEPGTIFLAYDKATGRIIDP